MRKERKILLFVLLMMLPSCIMAQCGIKNTAFTSGESLSYNLYFNWKFVWVKAGTASMNVSQETYNSQKAYCTKLQLQSNKKADGMFQIRDTLCCYTTTDIAPLYYRKGAREGKRYNIDEVRYTYPGSGCKLKLSRTHTDGTKDTKEKSETECAYDMLSIFMRSRNLDFSSWSVGKTLDFTLADGKNTRPGRLKYGGKKTIKADSGVKYQCLELLYMQLSDDGKWKDLARFYVTQDANHVPIRLDLFLKFGMAKAFLTSMSGVKNEVTSTVK